MQLGFLMDDHNLVPKTLFGVTCTIILLCHAIWSFPGKLVPGPKKMETSFSTQFFFPSMYLFCNFFIFHFFHSQVNQFSCYIRRHSLPIFLLVSDTKHHYHLLNTPQSDDCLFKDSSCWTLNGAITLLA